MRSAGTHRFHAVYTNSLIEAFLASVSDGR